MKKMMLAFAAFTFVFVSCSKDEDNDPTPPETSKSYQPLTVGSTWLYKSRNNAAGTDATYTLTATSGDSTINGKSYKVFSRTNASNEYYYNTGDQYYQFGAIANITAPTELLYLNSSVDAGVSWAETKDVNIPGLGVANLKITYTTVEKLASLIVEGKTYENVIHVKLELSEVKLGAVPVPVVSQDIHFYNAEGVGRIKQTVKLNITGITPVDNELSLTTATIVP
jgi:hypothetical protein